MLLLLDHNSCPLSCCRVWKWQWWCWQLKGQVVPWPPSQVPSTVQTGGEGREGYQEECGPLSGNPWGEQPGLLFHHHVLGRQLPHPIRAGPLGSNTLPGSNYLLLWALPSCLLLLPAPLWTVFHQPPETPKSWPHLTPGWWSFLQLVHVVYCTVTVSSAHHFATSHIFLYIHACI